MGVLREFSEACSYKGYKVTMKIPFTRMEILRILVLLFSKLYGYQQYVSCMIKLNQSNACGVMCIYVYGM